MLQQQIHPAQYKNVLGDNLINLAVVLEDTTTHERALAAEEFNIASPELIIKVTHTNYRLIRHRMQLFKNHICCVHLVEYFRFTFMFFLFQVADKDSIVLKKEHTATVTFINPFSHPVSGVLTVAGAGLINGKTQFR